MTSSAGAHDGTSTIIFLDVYADGTVEGTVEHPIVLLNELFGFDLDADISDATDIDGTQDVMRDFNANSFRIVADGESWPITFTDTVVIETENRLYAGYNFVVDRTFAEAPRAFDVTYTGIFDEVPGHVGFVVVRTDPKTGTFLNEVPVAGDENPVGTEFQTDLLTSNDTTSTVDLDDPNSIKALWGTIQLGMDHIFIGTDHILFLLVLLLPAVMLFSIARTWEPVPTFRGAMWRVLKIATMFTLAHSITLTLGGLEIIELAVETRRVGDRAVDHRRGGSQLATGVRQQGTPHRIRVRDLPWVWFRRSSLRVGSRPRAATPVAPRLQHRRRDRTGIHHRSPLSLAVPSSPDEVLPVDHEGRLNSPRSGRGYMGCRANIRTRPGDRFDPREVHTGAAGIRPDRRSDARVSGNPTVRGPERPSGTSTCYADARRRTPSRVFTIFS